MGLSSLPAPSEGVLTLLLVNTALSISIFKEIVRSILHIVGLQRPSDPDASDYLSDSYALSSPPSPEESLTDRFRSQVKAVRFGRQQQAGERQVVDCRVCLSRFEPDSVVNGLPCGHLFHKTCLEKWLDYHHVTCPLCRTRLLPGEESSSWSWF